MLFQAAARKAASKHAWKNGSRKLIFRQVLEGPAVSKIPANALISPTISLTIFDPINERRPRSDTEGDCS
jgi:hypothetical protein